MTNRWTEETAKLLLEDSKVLTKEEISKKYNIGIRTISSCLSMLKKKYPDIVDERIRYSTWNKNYADMLMNDYYNNMDREGLSNKYHVKYCAFKHLIYSLKNTYPDLKEKYKDCLRK